MYADLVTIERATPGTDDDFGNPTGTWAPYLEDVEATVQPIESSEQLTGRDEVVTRYRMHCGPDVDVTATDRVVWRDLTLQVDGDVELFSRRGSVHHLEMSLRRATA